MFVTSSQFGRKGGNGGDRFNDQSGGGYYSNSRRPNGFSQGNKSNHHSNNKKVVEETCRCRGVASPVSSASGRKEACCNLDHFLESTTPMVPMQYLPKTIMKGWRACEVEQKPYFTLDDLWESFNEWSAYGAGVPIVLNGGETVMQYYVPSLSAIQLYTQSSRPTNCSRNPGEESDISDGDYRDTSSEGSSDGEAERDLKYRGLVHHRNSKGFDCMTREDSSSDDGETSSCLRFQYFERAVPYSREPLADKITHLARGFPQLKTLTSIDLMPSSWLSVAWYPIYRIPTGPTLRDLAGCFLTFHSLSTPLEDGRNNQISVGEKLVPFNHVINSGGFPKIALPVFGLASYKYKNTVWSGTGSCERQQADSLLQSADEWLRLHQIEHPDYNFFLSHSSSYRR